MLIGREELGGRIGSVRAGSEVSWFWEVGREAGVAWIEVKKAMVEMMEKCAMYILWEAVEVRSEMESWVASS